jgi:lysozyme
MSVNKATLDLIREFEGLRLTAYQDIVGIWTIGYGITAAADVGIVPAKGLTITQERADELLRLAVEKFAAKVDELITVKVNQNERGACLSLSYNIGLGAFSKSTVLRELNAGRRSEAAAAFQMWNKAGGAVVKGLVRRREAERQLFLTPVTADMHVIAAPDKTEPESVLSIIIKVIMALFQGVKK